MKAGLIEKFRAVFGRAPEFLARAPGRIEFIGNHTDYNGGTVLGASIDRAVWVGLARREDGRRRFASDRYDEVVSLSAGPLRKMPSLGIVTARSGEQKGEVPRLSRVQPAPVWVVSMG